MDIIEIQDKYRNKYRLEDVWKLIYKFRRRLEKRPSGSASGQLRKRVAQLFSGMEGKYLSGTPASTKLKVFLLAHAALQPSGSTASRLWRAAQDLMPPSAVAAMAIVTRAFPAKKRSERHFIVLHVLARVEADSHADRSVFGGEVAFPSANQLIEAWTARRLLSTDDGSGKPVHIEDVFDEFANAESALWEAAIALGVPLSKRPPQKASMMGVCKYCWRTGFRGRKGTHLCSEHPSGTTAFSTACELREWRSPSQGRNHPIAYQSIAHDRICKPHRHAVGHFNGFSSTLLNEGKPDPMECRSFERSFDLQEFPYVKIFIENQLGQECLGPVDPLALLNVLDPLNSQYQQLHEAMRTALLMNHWKLLERVLLAEAFLETQAKRHDNHGGEREKMPEDVPEKRKPVYYLETDVDVWTRRPQREIG